MGQPGVHANPLAEYCSAGGKVNWRSEFIQDMYGRVRWVQVLQVDDQGLIDEVERGTIVGQVIIGDQDSYGCVEFGVKVGTC